MYIYIFFCRDSIVNQTYIVSACRVRLFLSPAYGEAQHEVKSLSLARTVSLAAAQDKSSSLDSEGELQRRSYGSAHRVRKPSGGQPVRRRTIGWLAAL